MANQTDQKDKNNRDKMTEEELKIALRPIWQGWSDSNRQHDFWRVAAYQLTDTPTLSYYTR